MRHDTMYAKMMINYHVDDPSFIIKNFDDSVTVKHVETYNIDTGKYEYFIPGAATMICDRDIFFSVDEPHNIVINGNSIHGYR